MLPRYDENIIQKIQSEFKRSKSLVSVLSKLSQFPDYVSSQSDDDILKLIQEKELAKHVEKII